MFTSTMTKGFQMTFDNGWRISVQWGAGNYCQARNLNYDFGVELKDSMWESLTAEIAIWDPKGYEYQFDTPTGSSFTFCHLTPNEVAEWISRVAACPGLPSSQQLQNKVASEERLLQPWGQRQPRPSSK